MREFNKESASKRDILEWIKGIIDARIKEEEGTAQHYRDLGERGQAIYFKNRLTWDYAAQSFIVRELEGCDNEAEDEVMPFVSAPLESLEE